MDNVYLEAIAEMMVDLRSELNKSIKALEDKQEELIKTRDMIDELPEWTDKIHRKDSYVTFNLGQTFKAVNDTAGSPESSPADWKRIGTGGMAFKGVYDDTKTYTVGDIYVKDGSSFLQVTNDTARIIAFRGKEGPKGVDINTRIKTVNVDDDCILRLSNFSGDKFAVDLKPAIIKMIGEAGLNMELIAELAAQNTAQAILEKMND